ncbi:2-aminoethylphosphonate--pyruvate transaminase [Dulcicalothrix desertica PCC 7102]|uniref:2-aminoethylphosphonate--pyruvate transaminase n=1 Tax=Dulcicalothrix desertica PCC 7102 TaxID=232991 RepID=A0A433V9H0_9CYAN|nr:2-aminoethylphosphonate aminotransferase [Dulcicalothrix desertica]RUT02766.1 2-aminoethylphosphonate--pyruvate transaminase [Dulcicalothrix desertica PCC 7102]TWH38999.1 2-aminoethylphosphonate-pyruvate transaminase [Dulcicalothrix desertica PCC 7102]
MILLNPGPVNLSARVRQALLQKDLCHREIEFSQLQSRIRNQILQVYNLTSKYWAPILLTGSGTAAVEAMLASLVPRNGRLLIIENGVYGERISKIAQIHGIEFDILHHSWGEPIDFDLLTKFLDSHFEITHLAIVHHETTTGRLNNLEELAQVCYDRNIKILVDAVSSFGGEEINFQAWGITACAATANKCLHGVPGTAFVVCQRAALPSSEIIPRTLYLDLGTYCRYQDEGATPFTQSPQIFYALTEALQELEDSGGWRARHANYAQLAVHVRNGLVSMGISPLLPQEHSSVVLNAYHLPNNFTYEAFHDSLKSQGYIIYAGQGNFAKSIFRVSTMGAISITDMERFLEVVKQMTNS